MLVCRSLRSYILLTRSSYAVVGCRVQRCNSSSSSSSNNSDRIGHDSELFTQTVILSNGASFTRRTTSPRSILRLTKDTRNHPLWNPTTQTELDDESGTLSKFTKRFGELDDLNDLSFFEMDEAEIVTTTNATSNKK